MAFSNVGKQVNPLYAGSARSQVTELYKLDTARIPTLVAPLIRASTQAPMSAMAGGASYESVAYDVTGRSDFMVNLYATAGTAAPTTLSVTIWGSLSNTSGSYQQIGAAITAPGFVHFTGFYNYIVVSIDTLTTTGTFECELYAVRP